MRARRLQGGYSEQSRLTSADSSLAHSQSHMSSADGPNPGSWGPGLLLASSVWPPSAFHFSWRSISSVRYDALRAERINLCLSRSFAEGRARGSRWRHAATNSRNGLEKRSASSGGGFLGIRNSTFIGCSEAYGGSPSASSIAVMPKLQMSALWS